jgi:sterol desaturase/sphingolipid hydroxylase (fatty acid hydroxylase superfamily)
MQLLYDRHTPEHHVVFVTDDMAVAERREWKLVLIPPWAIVAAFAAAIPLPATLILLGQWNAAMFFVATMMFYLVSYEWLHLSYHLPPDSFIGRLKLIAFLRRHHASHHDPRLMQKWNFNVTVPIWDLLLGTVYKPERAREGERTALA